MNNIPSEGGKGVPFGPKVMMGHSGKAAKILPDFVTP